MALELGSLKKAIQSLTSALTVYSDPKTATRTAAERDVLRAGGIQNFEFTYEVYWKFMKRWLETNVSPTMDGLTRKELFRLAAENKLIKKVEAWMLYHQSRNETSHTYDIETAEDVMRRSTHFWKMPKPCSPHWKLIMIDVEVSHRQIIETILQQRVPACEVRAFGSRVLGTAKSYSDLDLVIRGSEKLPRPVLYGLRDDFEECDLPYRIDLLDWNRLSPEFKQAILAHSEVLR